jgi:hypothetical protein
MRQDVYSVAYDEARAELLDIVRRFEELRRRKESLESVVIALGPILGVAGQSQSRPVAQPASEAMKAELTGGSPQPASYTLNQAPAPVPERDESITDPFQRRVRDALKFSNSNNGHDQKGLQPAI